MKSIIQFIKEAVENYRLNSVEVTYTIQPEEIILQAPETFQESDIQQYMDDMWLKALPSSQDYSEKFFVQSKQLCESKSTQTGNPKKTSASVALQAGRTFRDKGASNIQKSLAGGALS